MVRIQLTDCSPDHRRQFWVNRSLIRKNPDPWHDVIIPGLDENYQGTELPKAPWVYLEEDECGVPVPVPEYRPNDSTTGDVDHIDRSDEDFARDVGERLALDRTTIVDGHIRRPRRRESNPCHWRL